jgi:hypothetical protein
MSFRRIKLQLTLVIGLLFILAGLRDYFAPDFLSVGSGSNIDGTDKLLAGILIAVLNLLHRLRLRGIQPAKDL